MCVYIINKRIKRGLKGEETEKGVGFMKDKELKLEETETPHTLGGAGEGHVQGRAKGIGCICYSPVRYPIV